jgi:hypothetical protein
MQFSGEQLQAASRTTSIINQLMRGGLSARVSLSGAIPPADQGLNVRDTGIGTSLDIEA